MLMLTPPDNSPSESHLLLICSALALLLTLSLLRGLTVFLRTGNPCDSFFIVGATIALGVCWQSLPLMVDETFNQVIVPPFNHAASASSASASSASASSASSASASSASINLFHQSLTIVDLHASTLLWSHRNLNQPSHVGHVDVPKLVEGNIALTVFTIMTKSPFHVLPLNNDNTTSDALVLLGFIQQWRPSAIFGGTSLFSRALFQCGKPLIIHNIACLFSPFSFVFDPH